MKAKEYAEKYKRLEDPNIGIQENAELVKSMYRDMLDEMEALVKKRRIMTDSAFESLKKEFDQKGNAISANLGGALKSGWFLTLYDLVANSKKSDDNSAEKEDGDE